MPSYEEDISEFERRNAQVLGISMDNVRKTTVPALARAIDKVRPDAVILTGG